MTIHQKIASAIIDRYGEGKVLSRKEIVSFISDYYKGGICIGSILPSDLCINHKNEDPNSGIHHVFKKLPQRGYYEVLDHNIIRRSCFLD